MSTPVRLCEGGKISHPFNAQERAEIEWAAQNWQQENRLRQPPLWFSGSQSQTLNAAQNFAGVVAVGDATIEIYPKLDAALLCDDARPNDLKAQTVLSHLMWMLEVGAHDRIVPTNHSALDEEPSTFLDLWALLLGRRLLRELENGIARTYQYREEDLPGVRGRIRIAHQVTRNWNRMDSIACAWDEFTSDTPLNRAFKCSLQFLLKRVRQPLPRQLMESCLMFFDDVSEVDATTALQQTEYSRWDRSTERFRPTFELARRLLQSQGHQFGASGANTFVFLVNMAEVFENYVAAILAEYFQTEIQTQKTIGKLFQLDKGAISQIADYVWQRESTLFIGDAKYKHLTSGHNSPLSFENLADEVEEAAPIAGRVLSASDVRQLTVYAELAKEKYSRSDVRLLLLYPYVGANPRSSTATAWNNAPFSIVPVCVHRRESISECLPADFHRKPHTLN